MKTFSIKNFRLVCGLIINKDSLRDGVCDLSGLGISVNLEGKPIYHFMDLGVYYVSTKNAEYIADKHMIKVTDGESQSGKGLLYCEGLDLGGTIVFSGVTILASSSRACLLLLENGASIACYDDKTKIGGLPQTLIHFNGDSVLITKPNL